MRRLLAVSGLVVWLVVGAFVLLGNLGSGVEAQGPTGKMEGQGFYLYALPFPLPFSYQGQLTYSGAPINGLCDLQFSLYDNLTNGTLLEGPEVITHTQVTNGLFSVALRLGEEKVLTVMPYIEVGVRCPADTGTWTTLAPRQALTPAFWARYALALPGLRTTNVTAAVPNVVGGGSGNQVVLDAGIQGGTIGGGGSSVYTDSNQVVANFGTIGGGAANQAGKDTGPNQPDIQYATVGGGHANGALSNYTTIAGGDRNVAVGANVAIAGGVGNVSLGDHAAMGGGEGNFVGCEIICKTDKTDQAEPGNYATIAGGRDNNVAADYGTISGGAENNTFGSFASVGGGRSNVAGPNSTVGGGQGNGARGDADTVGGGRNNTVTSTSGTIGGGLNNFVINPWGTVSGGRDNAALGGAATVGGGSKNTANGEWATVPGGANNMAAGDYSLAAGYRAGAMHRGSFVWADPTTPFTSTAANQFLIHASSGVGINTASPQQALSVQGGINLDQGNVNAGSVNPGLTFGSGSGEGVASRRMPGANRYGLDFYTNFASRLSITQDGKVGIGTSSPTHPLTMRDGAYEDNGMWVSNSDRNLKANFAPVDSRTILERVAGLPIQRWNYRTEDPSIHHIGPMAQDFYATFGVGVDDKHITSVDEGGVALAAIQGLYQAQQAKDGQIAALTQQVQTVQAENATLQRQVQAAQAENAALRTQMDDLAQRMTRLERQGGAPSGSPSPTWPFNPVLVLALAAGSVFLTLRRLA